MDTSWYKRMYFSQTPVFNTFFVHRVLSPRLNSCLNSTRSPISVTSKLTCQPLQITPANWLFMTVMTSLVLIEYYCFKLPQFPSRLEVLSTSSCPNDVWRVEMCKPVKSNSKKRGLGGAARRQLVKCRVNIGFALRVLHSSSHVFSNVSVSMCLT